MLERGRKRDGNRWRSGSKGRDAKEEEASDSFGRRRKERPREETTQEETLKTPRKGEGGSGQGYENSASEREINS